MSKKKKEMKNGTRVTLFTVIIIVVIALIGFAAYKILVPSNNEPPKKEEQKNEVSIDGYGITLDDFDTDLYREEYNILKDNLLGEEIDCKAYAESVAKLFIIDLYTIKNKVNKYEVGGLDFVYPEGRENYKNNVTDTIYKYVEDNTENNRKQQLPVVSSVEITKTTEKKYKIESEDKSYDAYIFDLDWKYSVDLGYDKTGEVTVIKKDNKMYVVEKN